MITHDSCHPPISPTNQFLRLLSLSWECSSCRGSPVQSSPVLSTSAFHSHPLISSSHSSSSSSFPPSSTIPCARDYCSHPPDVPLPAHTVPSPVVSSRRNHPILSHPFPSPSLPCRPKFEFGPGPVSRQPSLDSRHHCPLFFFSFNSFYCFIIIIFIII